jgi:hypothetical protein
MNRIKKKIINFDFLVVISLICFFTLINSIRVYNKLNDLEINTTNIIFMILTTILFTLVYYFKYKKNKFFYVAFILSYVMLSIRYPTNSFASEIWAEAGTNFYMNAANHGWVTNLKALDYSYLPLNQRLISLLVVKILNIQENFMVIFSFFSLTFTSLFFASINFKTFQNIIQKDISRFIVSLYFILLYEVGYEQVTFINYIYFGSLLIFLMLFLEYDKLNKKELIFITVITSIIMLSKGSFVAFLPLYGILLLKSFYFKKKKQFIYLLVSFISGFTQFLIMTKYPGERIINIKKFVIMVPRLYYETFNLILKSLTGNIFKMKSLTFILINIIIIIFLYKRKKRKII